MIECPFTGEPIALLPALILDVGIIHVHRADACGNAQIDGISGFAFEMARACKRLIVSAEEIVDTEVIRRRPDRTTIPYYLVDAVVEPPFHDAFDVTLRRHADGPPIAIARASASRAARIARWAW